MSETVKERVERRMAERSAEMDVLYKETLHRHGAMRRGICPDCGGDLRERLKLLGVLKSTYYFQCTECGNKHSYFYGVD